MDGYQASENIRSGQAGISNTHIPIVAMTANAMQGDREKCLAAGMNDYLTKPIDKDLVVEKLTYWLKQQ
jgi:CheY-like chemotaxis protein